MNNECKLFTKRFRLDVRKFTFSNNVIDSLPELCVNSAVSAAVNCFNF